MASNATLINGARVSVDAITSIRIFHEASVFDERKVPKNFIPRAMVHFLSGDRLPEQRSVQELADALEFPTFSNGADAIALNPNYAHYQIEAIKDDERYRASQQTKISWKVNGSERKVYVTETVDEVLQRLPKSAKHMQHSHVITSSRPSVVRDMPLTERKAEV